MTELGSKAVTKFWNRASFTPQQNRQVKTALPHHMFLLKPHIACLFVCICEVGSDIKCCKGWEGKEFSDEWKSARCFLPAGSG